MKAERVGAVHPGEKKIPGRPQSLFQYLKDHKRVGEGLLARAWSDRTRENDFKLREGGFR